MQPLIPLGSVGSSASCKALPWQVVGYSALRWAESPTTTTSTSLARIPALPPQRGFAFLVDAEDGWSWCKPITGAPQSFGRERQQRRYLGTIYQLYDYNGKVTYVAGEFYWQVERDQQHRQQRLRRGTGAASMEQLEPRGDLVERHAGVVCVARGEALRADTAQKAFGSARRARGADATRRDVQALGARQDHLLLFVVVLVIAARCGSGAARRLRGSQSRGVAGVRLPQPAAAAHAAAAARSAAFRAAAATSRRLVASSTVRCSEGEHHGGLEWLKPAVIFGSVLYALIGVVDLLAVLRLVDKITPYNLWDEIVEKKNMALAIVVGAMCIAIGMIVAAAVHG